MAHKWTMEEENTMRNEYPRLGCTKCATLLGIGYKSVKSKAKRMGLKGPHRTPLTSEQIEYFKANYSDISTAEIADKLGVSESVVYHLAETYGLKKSKEFRITLGREIYAKASLSRFSFKKGHTPFCKGKKQTEWMSPEGIKRCEATRYKPGHKPQNWRPVGSERINIYGYIEVKVKDEQYGWRAKHRVVWESTHGPIPPGYNVMFKDGDRQNCDIDNLYLASNQDKMVRNTIHHLPKDLKDVIMINGLLKREINKQLNKR